MDKKLLYKILIKGRVQGVGFRWNAANEAELRGICGFVRNMPDGSVYIEAEGPGEILDDYIKWCRQGPRFASVNSVTVETLPPAGYGGFTIEH